jgi:hypothetical protein
MEHWDNPKGASPERGRLDEVMICFDRMDCQISQADMRLTNDNLLSSGNSAHAHAVQRSK